MGTIEITPEQIQKIKEIIWNWALRKARRELAGKEEQGRKASW